MFALEPGQAAKASRRRAPSGPALRTPEGACRGGAPLVMGACLGGRRRAQPRGHIIPLGQRSGQCPFLIQLGRGWMRPISLKLPQSVI